MTDFFFFIVMCSSRIFLFFIYDFRNHVRTMQCHLSLEHSIRHSKNIFDVFTTLFSHLRRRIYKFFHHYKIVKKAICARAHS